MGAQRLVYFPVAGGPTTARFRLQRNVDSADMGDSRLTNP